MWGISHQIDEDLSKLPRDDLAWFGHLLRVVQSTELWWRGQEASFDILDQTLAISDVFGDDLELWKLMLVHEDSGNSKVKKIDILISQRNQIMSNDRGYFHSVVEVVSTNLAKLSLNPS